MGSIKQNFDLNKSNHKKNNKFWENIFGDKAFIILMFSLFLPSAIQQLVTTSVTYIDTFFIAGFAPKNIEGVDITSIGLSSGEIAKTSVGIATSIINFPMMVVLGVSSGIGIVTAQYFGAKDREKLQQTIIYKLIVGSILMLPFLILMAVIPTELINVTRNVFNFSNNSKDYYISKVASEYLQWSTISFVFILLAYTLSYSYREIGKPKFALIAAVISVCSNVIMDPLIIIFEKDLINAARNVALSTVVSRLIECIVNYKKFMASNCKWFFIWFCNFIFSYMFISL